MFMPGIPRSIWGVEEASFPVNLTVKVRSFMAFTGFGSISSVTWHPDKYLVQGPRLMSQFTVVPSWVSAAMVGTHIRKKGMNTKMNISSFTLTDRIPLPRARRICALHTEIMGSSSMLSMAMKLQSHMKTH
jgi:hypothetical protein